MATSIPANDPTPNQDLKKPNHMIIWLDQHIGKPGECTHLKKAFAINIDPRHETWIKLNDRDYDRLHVTGDEMIVEFNGVKVLLHASDNEDACVEAFKRNQDKRIFFITSGSMGKTAVPRIIERYRNIFTDPITDEAYSSVYVFCLHIEYNREWAEDYLDYIQMFDTESELLERMIRDIAGYFIKRSERVLQDGESKSALQYLYWAKRLWHQNDKALQRIRTDDVQEVRLSDEMKKILAKIAEIEKQYPKNSSDDENTNNDVHETANHFTQQNLDDDDPMGNEAS